MSPSGYVFILDNYLWVLNYCITTFLLDGSCIVVELYGQ